MVSFSRPVSLLLLLLTAAARLAGWDDDGHRAVNRIALASLPADFPAFARTPEAAARIIWLSSEPDRWRSSPDLPVRHVNAPDHYLDVEYLALAGMDAATVPGFRYDFAHAFATARAVHAGNFAPVDPQKNTDRTRELSGFLPWTIAEYFGKLRAGFARLKVLEELGSPEEVAQTKAALIELMGVMGHFVGDAAQPLHTTMHHNGWVGANPEGYTQWPGLHAWIDGGFVAKAGLHLAALADRATPATPLALAAGDDGRDPAFVHAMDFVLASHALMEPLYRMERAKQFRAENNPPDAEAVAFIEGQMLRAGELLGRYWLTAWSATPPDPYLRSQLLRRQNAARS